MVIALVIGLVRSLKGLVRFVARWFGPKQPSGGGQRAEDRAQPTAGPVMVTWEEAEQLLAAGLLAGLVGQAEYQDALELLARDDDARSPLQVPSLRDR